MPDLDLIQFTAGLRTDDLPPRDTNPEILFRALRDGLIEGIKVPLAIFTIPRGSYSCDFGFEEHVDSEDVAVIVESHGFTLTNWPTPDEPEVDVSRLKQLQPA